MINIQKEFTKADLKEGMVAHLDDGNKTVLVNDYYITKNDFECLNGRLILKQSGRKVTKIEYGNEVVWEPQPNKMTSEEMRKKLEELTGEKIEVEPSREEMIGRLYLYCEHDGIKCDRCVIRVYGKCNILGLKEKQLRTCYEKVIEDGRKES